MATNAPHRIVFDVECYRDYFLVMFRSLSTGKTLWFDMYPGKELDARRVAHILHSNELVSFNGIKYDVPMLTLALSGADNMELKQASDYLVLNDEATPWNFEKRYQVRLPALDHVDMYEVAPGYMISLKLYGGRLHSQKLQDLPIDPDASISREDREELKLYCGNDLQTTIDLYNKLRPQLELRNQMSVEYRQDLRSKSDAQIAEAVIKSEIEKLQGMKLKRPNVQVEAFQYDVPEWMEFHSPDMKELLQLVADTKFTVEGNVDGETNGKVKLPLSLAKRDIRIGDSVYRMGIGGLHSTESKVAHVCDDSFILVDRDVTSYYPSIILNQGLYPPNIGPDFLTVYRSIVERRVAAKRNKDKVVDGTLKIVINGSFGKLGSKWSVLYAPKLMIQVTLTGQLALLMLIELLERNCIPVVSANTDGVVIKCPVGKADQMNSIIRGWEGLTGFNTEETRYKALYSRDVNNYLAVKPDNTVKLKGVFADPGLAKNPVNTVVVEAAVKQLTLGVPVEETIRGCEDVTKFLTVRSVTGGGVQGGIYLGKVVRWYYSSQSPGPIVYKKNGNKVARSDGTRAMMQLGGIPDDIDYTWYVNEANCILADVGAA